MTAGRSKGRTETPYRNVVVRGPDGEEEVKDPFDIHSKGTTLSKPTPSAATQDASDNQGLDENIIPESDTDASLPDQTDASLPDQLDFPIANEIPKDAKASGIVIMRTGQILLALASSTAGVLYITPAKQCVQDLWCGEYLVDLFMEFGCDPELAASISAWILTASGGSGYDAGAMYFGFEAIPAWKKLYDEQKYDSIGITILAKTLVVSGIPLLASIAPAAIFIVSRNLGASALELFLSTMGAVPGSLFAAVETVREAPRTASNIYTGLKLFAQKYHRRELQPHQESLQYYSDLQEKFNETLYLKFKTLIAQASKLTPDDLNINITNIKLANGKITRKITEKTPPLDYLMNLAESEGMRESKALNGFNTVGGIVLGTVISAPFVSNRYTGFRSPTDEETIEYHLSQSPFALLSLALSYSEIFGNIHLMKKALEALVEILRAAITHEHIESLEFQRHPIRIATAFSLLSLWQVLSYAVANRVTAAEVDPWPNEDARNGSIVGISTSFFIYHAISMCLLFLMLYATARSMFPAISNPVDVYLDKVKASYQELKGITLHEFIAWVEALPEEKRADYKLLPYVAPSIDAQQANASERTPLIGGSVTRGFFAKLHDCLSCQPNGDDPDVDPSKSYGF